MSDWGRKVICEGEFFVFRERGLRDNVGRIVENNGGREIRDWND